MEAFARSTHMRRSVHARVAGIVLLALMGITCGGSSGSSGSGSNGSSSGSPTAPGPPTTTNSCRTYPTNANVQTTTSGTSIVFNALVTGDFDTSTRKATVTTKFANGAPCSVLVSNYNSVADFVDEVRVVPPVFHTTGTVGTNSGSCGTGTVTGAYTYDAQRRLTQISNSAGGVTTYTAWDSAGRPTVGTSTANGVTSSTTITYDDAARSWSSVQTAPNGTKSLGTLTFDADGNQLKNVVVDGNVTTTTTYTNTATAKVCK
jgi:YD repeat-containing protein